MEVEESAVDDDNFISRDYQDELLEICIQRNTLIYLPTGAGKTIIGIMAIKHFANDLKKSIADGGKRSIFLTNTVVLAKQQCEVITKWCHPLKSSVYTGDMTLDNWRRDKWQLEFEKNHIIVATCQIVLDILRHNFIKLTDFNVIIFDECHHGRNSHPMQQLMSLFGNYPEEDLPRVVGLSGMLTSSSIKPQNVIADLEELEATFRSTIATVKGSGAFKNVLLFSTCPKELLVKYDNHLLCSTINYITDQISSICRNFADWPIDQEQTQSDNIESRLSKISNPFSKTKKLLNDFTYQIEDLGLYGGHLAMLGVLVELELKKRGADVAFYKILYRYLITRCEELLHIISNALDQDVDEEQDVELEKEKKVMESKESIIVNSSPKVKELLLFLTKYVQQNENSVMKCIVFVQRRRTAKILYHVIKRYAIAANLPIHPDFMVGANTVLPEPIEIILQEKTNRRVLNKFSRNETNLIVASSVLEEGIDLQVCNLVIHLDIPKSFQSYVQTKGRARMANSFYVIFLPHSKEYSLTMKLKEWEQVDHILKEFLVERAIDRIPPSNNDIEKAIGHSLIKPLVTPAGARVDYRSAISLLNRYCMTLPSDQFTVPAVIWKKIKDEQTGKVAIKLLLPVQSSIRDEIVGDYMSNLKNAKRDVAVKTCKILWEQGELNDHLMPINKTKCLENIKSIYFSHWDNDEFANDKPRLAGTKKNVRMHDITIPECFLDSAPRALQMSYMYKIDMHPKFTPPIDDTNIQIFHRLFQSNRCFAIITSKPIPHLAKMTLFQSFGAISCSVSTKAVELTLNEDELMRLRRYHVVLFKDVVGTWKEFFLCDFKHTYIIAPTDGHNILWDIVNEFQAMDSLSEKTEAERLNVTYRKDDWLHRVICPWYRADLNSRYIVTKVLEHLTPNSEFPNTEHASYADYVFEKYQAKVMQPEQFLIEVKAVTTKLTRLYPGEGEDGKKTSTMRGPEILIPELCHNFSFPGDLWLKMTMLPSVLHRIQYLLLAEEVRVKINNYVGLNIQNYEPLPVMEKMKRRPHEDFYNETPQISSAPLINSIPQVIDYTEHEALSKYFDLPWADSDEPLDLNRNLDELYPFEIDYHFEFINKRYNFVDEYHIANIVQSQSQYKTKPLAICARPSKEKMRINILNITESIRGVEQHELLAAITPHSSSDVFDMERLEVLGDAFLKFSISFYLIHAHPTWHEGFLTTAKGKLVSNRNLCYHAISNNLPGIIKGNRFNPLDDWMPPMVHVSEDIVDMMRELKAPPVRLYDLVASNEEFYNGELSKETLQVFISCLNQRSEFNISSNSDTSMQNFLGRQNVPDKTVADCVEAILGACLKSFGVSRNFKVLELFKILPKTSFEISEVMNIKLKSPRIRTNISNHDVDSFLINYEELERIIDYKFKDRAYLLQALTHPSYPTNRLTGCYQQLEFLGDAVLDFLVTSYIYEQCTDMDPGQLTDLRSALVNNITLACICVRNQIHNFILSQNIRLTESIIKFTDFQERHNHEVTEHVQLLMSESETEAIMAEYTEVPKTLGDILEAIIGGIFLDSGNDLKETWRVIYRLLQNEFDKFMTNVPKEIVRQLFEMQGVHAEFDSAVEIDDRVMMKLNFTLHGVKKQVFGFGLNKYAAKKAAAKTALHLLKGTDRKTFSF